MQRNDGDAATIFLPSAQKGAQTCLLSLARHDTKALPLEGRWQPKNHVNKIFARTWASSDGSGAGRQLQSLWSDTCETARSSAGLMVRCL